MTIGRNSRMGSVRSSIRAPKFLDKTNGFYGRLDEPEANREREEEFGGEVEKDREGGIMSGALATLAHSSGVQDKEDVEAFDFTEGLMEDDGETLLRRKPSRRSSRWRRSSRRKQKEGRDEGEAGRDERPSRVTETPGDDLVPLKVEPEMKAVEEEDEKMAGGKESVLVHFSVREEADDRVLIRDQKRGREEEGEEERKMKIEQEEGMKVVKRKNYRKALDRAFRRGWETFITNLYSVTLTPVTSSSPPSSKKKLEHNSALAEIR